MLWAQLSLNPTSQSERKLISDLKNLPKGTAEIVYVESDGEASQFAKILCACMNSAGWSVSLKKIAPRPGMDRVTGQSSGIWLYSQSVGGEYEFKPDWLKGTNSLSWYKTENPKQALCVSLDDCGFPVAGSASISLGPDPDLKPGVLEIEIQKKAW